MAIIMHGLKTKDNLSSIFLHFLKKMTVHAYKTKESLICLCDNLDSRSDFGPFANLKTFSHQDKCL